MITSCCLSKFQCCNSFLFQLPTEQQRGVCGAVHQPGGVPDASGEEEEQGRGWVPRQHPVAEELLAPGLTTILPTSCCCYCYMIIFYSRISAVISCNQARLKKNHLSPSAMPCMRPWIVLPPVVKPKEPPNLTTLLQTCIFPESLHRACNLYWTIM